MDANLTLSDLQDILENGGISGRTFASIAYAHGFSPDTIAEMTGVSRRTIASWVTRYNFAKRDLSGLSPNYILRRLEAINLLSLFISPPARTFGKSAPLKNRNNEIHGIHSQEGLRQKQVLRECRLVVRQMRAKTEGMRQRLPR